MSWFAPLAYNQAHDDLGHVAKAQTLGAGLNIGMAILESYHSRQRRLDAPIAGSLIARSDCRHEEYAADRHGVAIRNVH